MNCQLTLHQIASRLEKLTREFNANKSEALGLASEFGWHRYYHWVDKLDCLELACKAVSTDPEFLTACGFPPPKESAQRDSLN